VTLYRPLSTFTPSNSGNADSALSVGVEFTVSTTCTLTEIRWYQASAGTTDTSTRQGALYTTTNGTTGTLVASATSAAPSGSGWQALTIPGGYTLSSGVRYRAAVLHPAGGYSADAHFFDSGSGASGITVGPVTVVSQTGSINSMQQSFHYSGSISFPDGQFNAGCYWVDVSIDDGASTVLPPVTGGGSLAFAATRGATGTFGLPGGLTGDSSGTKFTHAQSVILPAIYGVGAYGVVNYGDLAIGRPAAVSEALTLSGGGEIRAVAAKGADGDPSGLSGGGNLNLAGIEDHRGVLTLTGGGLSVAQATKYVIGDASTLTGDGSGTVAASKMAQATFTLGGGGDTSLISGRFATTTVAITGGGTPVLTGSKQGHGQPLLTGGGATFVATATRSGTASFDLTGDGGATFTGLHGEYAVATLSGGGNGLIHATKATTGALTQTGGGDANLTVSAGRLSDIAITGDGALSGEAEKGSYTDFAVTGGGDIATFAAKGAYAQLVVTGGGQLVITGLRATQAQWAITGGGHLFGPFPIVLYAAIKLRTNNATTKVLTRQGAVLVRTNESKVARPVRDVTALTR
jgi:hypothetical protein